MSEITKYFRVKHSDCYFPFTMSYLDEFTNGDIKRIMKFTGNEEIEEISFDEYVNVRHADFNWDDMHSILSIDKPKPRIRRHRTTDECKKNRIAKRRKKNKNKKTYRK